MRTKWRRKTKRTAKLTVLDLFCGAGGLSEGFRQAGFHIVAGLDKDKWAIETFRKNHPESIPIHADILKVKLRDLAGCEVLLGAPPCVDFSSSKRGGNGAVLDGLLLVRAFLRAVYYLKPRWWIMENVPRITKFLPDKVPLRWIGIRQKGFLPIPVRAVFNTADYGVPQARKRFLMGNFPIPQRTHLGAREHDARPEMHRRSPWKTLGEVLGSLPDPMRNPRARSVRDFNYGFAIPVAHLTDHFRPSVLTSAEAKRLRRVKQLHPFYGKMSFPDDLSRPARTVVATHLGRETLVIRTKHGGKAAFRRATVRECATLQTFPNTYQFWGPLNARYRLAGDAVPPMISYAIALQILREDKRRVPRAPAARTQVIELTVPAPVKQSGRKRVFKFPPDRRFREFVPGKEIRGCRVDLDNRGPKFTHTPEHQETSHVREWVARLYVGEGKGVQQRRVGLSEAMKEFAGYCTDDDKTRQVQRFLEDMRRRLHGRLPDATSLQAAWCGLVRGATGPYQVTHLLSSIVNRHFPRKKYHDVRVPPNGMIKEVPSSGLRVRIAAALVVTAYATELINNRSRSMTKRRGRRVFASGWRSRGLATVAPRRIGAVAR